MNLTKKIASAAVSAALMATTFAPAVFASSLEISGNGVGSHNAIKVTNVCANGVWQSNKTSANTFVIASSNTGGNQASFNTGGSTHIGTGDATTTVNVTVTGGDNEATVPSCCECVDGSSDATIIDNGAFSHNKIRETNVSITLVGQKTKTTANTTVFAKSNTGKNKASWNTGNGTSIDTGNAETTVDVTVEGGSNTLN